MFCTLPLFLLTFSNSENRVHLAVRLILWEKAFRKFSFLFLQDTNLMDRRRGEREKDLVANLAIVKDRKSAKSSFPPSFSQQKNIVM